MFRRRVTAKALILDLLSTTGRRPVPVRALVEAGRLFDVAENPLRVALARLLADGRVLRDQRGEYALSTGDVSLRIRRWHSLDEELRPWGDAWVGVHRAGPPRARGASARARERALRFLGLAELAPGLHVRPDNLAGGVAGARRLLVGLGLEPSTPVLGLVELDPALRSRAWALWDVAGLAAGYRATRERLERSARALPGLDRAAARVESFELGGAAIRQLVLDPLLPDELAPSAGLGRERRALVDTMKAYDRLGREAWRGWLGDGRESTRPVAARFPTGMQSLEALEAKGAPT